MQDASAIFRPRRRQTKKMKQYIKKKKTIQKKIDPENTCYIREMMEDGRSVNFIYSLNFTTVNKTSLNKNQKGEFWPKTTCKKEEINSI